MTDRLPALGPRRWRRLKSQRVSPTLLMFFVLAAISALGAAVTAVTHFTSNDEPAQDWTFERMGVDVVVEPDGSVRVTERLDVAFDGEPRHGIVRVVPRRGPHTDTHDRQIDVDVVAGHVEGVPGDLQVDVNDDAVHIRTGSEEVLLEGPQRVEMTYRVRGAIEREADGAKLVWNVTGRDWPVSIGATEGTLTIPGLMSADCFEGPRGATDRCARLETAGETVRFAASELAPGEELTVEAVARPGSVAVPEARIVRKEGWRVALAVTPGTVGATFATSILFLGGAVAWTRRGRDVWGDGSASRRRRLGEVFPSPIAFRPPAGLKPAHLGLIEDEYVDADDMAATVVDLAARDHLRIEERFRDGLWEWELVRQAPPDDPLDPFEERLLDGLFGDEDRVSLHDLEGTFARHFDAVAALLYDEAIERGWFVASPDLVRRRYAVVGLFGTIAAAIAFIAAYETSTWALPFVPPFLAGLLMLAAWTRMPARTAEGSRLLSEIRGLRRYLETAEVEAMRFAQDQGALLTLLPHAIALGLTDRWSRIIGAATGELPDVRGLRPLFRGAGDLCQTVDNFAWSVGASLIAGPGGPGQGGGSSGSAGGGFGGGGGRAW